jgi:hypothetical protein
MWDSIVTFFKHHPAPIYLLSSVIFFLDGRRSQKEGESTQGAWSWQALGVLMLILGIIAAAYYQDWLSLAVLVVAIVTEGTLMFRWWSKPRHPTAFR